MRIHSVEGVSFGSAIIDSHMHSGHWKRTQGAKELLNFDNDFMDRFVKSPLEVSVQGVKQKDSVEKAIISNLDCFVDDGLKDEIAGNKAMLDFCEKNPKFFALAACQPSKTNGNATNINRLISENPGKFVGLKFHPRNFKTPADSDVYRAYMYVAKKNNLPCVFHSDVSIDETGNVADNISSPEAIYRAAKVYPDVPVVMAHMGAGDAKSHQNAIEVLLKSIDNNDAKLYVDLSWVDWGANGLSSSEQPSVVTLIKELQKRNATDRILFGTDAPLGCFGEALRENYSPVQAYEKSVGDLKTVIKQNFNDKADELIEKIFYKNADELFFQKQWAQVKEKNIKSISTLKVVSFIGLALAALGVLGLLADKMSPSKEVRFNK